MAATSASSRAPRAVLGLHLAVVLAVLVVALLAGGASAGGVSDFVQAPERPGNLPEKRQGPKVVAGQVNLPEKLQGPKVVAGQVNLPERLAVSEVLQHLVNVKEGRPEAPKALKELLKLKGVSSAAGQPDTLDFFVPANIWGVDADELSTSCSCLHWTCGCCARVEIAALRKNKTGCVNLSFVQDSLSLVLQMSVNNHAVSEKVLVSGSSPPPYCFPVSQLPVCLRFSNISLTEDTKVQVCTAVELRLAFTSPLIRLRFGCLQIGLGGIAWSRYPMSRAFKVPTHSETEAIQHLAAALNTAENEQNLLWQSLLRQLQTTQPAKSQKMGWPNIYHGIPRN